MTTPISSRALLWKFAKTVIVGTTCVRLVEKICQGSGYEGWTRALSLGVAFIGSFALYYMRERSANLKTLSVSIEQESQGAAQRTHRAYAGVRKPVS